MVERNRFVICGRVIGTYAGWEQADTHLFIYDGFQPAEKYAGPKDDVVSVDLHEGTLTTHDGDSEIKERVDLIDAIKDCDRV